MRGVGQRMLQKTAQTDTILAALGPTMGSVRITQAGCQFSALSVATPVT